MMAVTDRNDQPLGELILILAPFREARLVGTISRSSMNLLHLALSCFALASADNKVVTPQPTTVLSAKAERLSEMSAKLEARLAAPYDKKRLEFTLEQVDLHLAKLKEEDKIEVDFGEQTLIRPELQAYRSWNLPMLHGTPNTKLHDFEDEDNQIHTIIAYGRALEAHDIDFLVVPIPMRLDLYPERLPNITREDAYRGGNRGMMRFMLELTKQGVEIVDLYGVFQEKLYAENPDDDYELYFQREYHWTQRAVHLASEAMATVISDRESYSPGSLREGVDFLIREEREPWDIISATGKETVELLFRKVEKQDGSRAFAPNRESEILLLGDSFMLLFRERNSDLAGQLSAKLRQPLDRIAMSGGSAKRVWQSVARRRNQLAGKKLVVWNFASRVLTSAALQPVKIFEN